MKDDGLKCPGCQGPHINALPYQWKSTGRVHQMTQTMAIVLVTRCCGAMAHTEAIAFTGCYLFDGKANADLICELVNKYNIEHFNAHQQNDPYFVW